MTHWEYYMVCGRFGVDSKPGKQFLADLNALGREGWEVVGIAGDIMKGAALMKRPVSDG